MRQFVRGEALRIEKKSSSTVNLLKDGVDKGKNLQKILTLIGKTL